MSRIEFKSRQANITLNDLNDKKIKSHQHLHLSLHVQNPTHSLTPFPRTKKNTTKPNHATQTTKAHPKPPTFHPSKPADPHGHRHDHGHRHTARPSLGTSRPAWRSRRLITRLRPRAPTLTQAPNQRRYGRVRVPSPPPPAPAPSRSPQPPFIPTCACVCAIRSAPPTPPPPPSPYHTPRLITPARMRIHAHRRM